MVDPFAAQEYKYRASELGACTKRLVAARMGLPVSTDKIPDSIQKIFDRGNEHEVACLATMRAKGWDVWGEQEDLCVPLRVETKNGWETLEITGHPDCMTRPPWVHPELSFVGEIKSPTSYDNFIRECYLPECSALTEHYKWQLSFYMVTKRAQGILLSLAEDFTIQFKVYEEPFYTWDDIKNRIEDIEELARKGELPKYCNVRDYPCPYFKLHTDEDVEFTEDTGLDIMVERWHRAQQVKKQNDKEIAYVRQIIAEHMGDTAEKTTPNSRVSMGTRTTTKYDYAGMRKDGIPVDDYKSTSESAPYPTITYKGESE